MRSRLSLFVAATVCLLAVPAAADEIPWMHDVDAAIRVAQQTNRLVLVHFYTDSCPPCKRLENNVYSQPGVGREIAANFVPVKINAQEQPAVARKMGVDRWPTDVILDSRGEFKGKQRCPQDRGKYLGGLAMAARYLGPTTVAPQVQVAANTARPAASPFAAPPISRNATSAVTPPAATAPTSPAQPPAYTAPAATAPRTAAAPTSGYKPPSAQAQPQPRANYQPQPGYQPPAVGGPTAPRVATAPTYTSPGVNPQAGVVRPTSEIPALPPRAAQAVTSPAPPVAPVSQPAPRGYQPPVSYQPPAVTPPAGHQVPAPSPGYQAPPTNAYTPSAPYQPQPQPRAAVPPRAPAPSADASSSAWNPPPRQAGLPVAPPQPRPQFALDGTCPVELAERRHWVTGDVRYGAVHLGQTYLFAGPEQQRKFMANPYYYAPAISGLDPILAFDHGQKVPGKREHGVTYGDGPARRVYLFANEANLAKFQRDTLRYTHAVRQAEAAQPIRR